MSANDEQFISAIEDIAASLTSAHDLISTNNIYDFHKQTKTLRENLKAVKEENRAIRIGIVGEVKAGKSSFVNALIFNGESILPKAPTPMTAALTKITYGKEFEGTIVFYSNKDWHLIEQTAQEAEKLLGNLYDDHIRECGNMREPMPQKKFYLRNENKLPLELKSCKELVEMAKRNEIDFYELLDTSIKIHAKDQQDFMHVLNKYVGSDGQFTPIVKHTEIQLNNEMLKNAEIIDTPGLNDPVASRGRTTIDFLMKCDIVFFLSYTGQFLTKEDLDFLSNILPGESVNSAVLIGSKFDSGILDYKEQYAPLRKALKASVQTFNGQADSIFNEVLKDSNCAPILRTIGENLPPKYVSAIMYTIAKKQENQQVLSEEEEHIMSTFESRFQGFSRNPEFLKELSNVENIKNVELEKILIKKDEIIAEKIKATIIDKKKYFLNELESINIQARANREDLQSHDLNDLQNKIDLISKKLKKVRYNVSEIFINGGIEAQKMLEDIKVEIEREIDNHMDLSVATSRNPNEGVRRVGFFGLKKEHYSYTVETKTTNVQEAVANIRKYVVRSRELVNNQFNQLFDLNALKKQITNEIVSAFDLVDEEFDEQDILLPLNSALGRITIPKFQVEAYMYEQKLISEFPSSFVKNEEIHDLVLSQDRIMTEINLGIVKNLDEKAEEIKRLLLIQATTFVDNIENQLRDNIEKVQKLLTDKENSLQKYNELIDQIDKHKKQLVECF